MYVTTGKRLTMDGAKKMMATAIDMAKQAGVALTVAIADAGGHLVLLERMEGGRFHTVHSSTVKAVCAASNKRMTSARGAQAQELDVAHALGLALAAGPERWTAMEGGCPVSPTANASAASASPAATGRPTSASRKPRSSRSARAGNSIMTEPLRVACIGMGWWSDVLADAIQRSSKLKIIACFTRSEDKRNAFAKKYGCTPVASYEAILKDKGIEAIINTTPNDVHLETTRQAAAAGKHVFLDKPIANSVSDGRKITEACRQAGVTLALGYQRRRESHFRWVKQQIDAGVFGKLVNAEANISRDRLGQFDLSSWRYTAAGMPGGVMLQIGIHYVDVLDLPDRTGQSGARPIGAAGAAGRQSGRRRASSSSTTTAPCRRSTPATPRPRNII